MAKVVLFGRLADIAGWRAHDAPDLRNTSDLRRWLATLDPALGEAIDGPGVQVAVDQILARGETPLRPGAEVAFMPPMSGG